MKKVAIIFLAVAILSGCEKKAESVQKAGVEFEVGKLFTVEGCTVWRFYDGGRPVYFSSCKGESGYKQTSGGKVKTTTYVSAINNGRLDTDE